MLDTSVFTLCPYSNSLVLLLAEFSKSTRNPNYVYVKFWKDENNNNKPKEIYLQRIDENKEELDYQYKRESNRTNEDKSIPRNSNKKASKPQWKSIWTSRHSKQSKASETQNSCEESDWEDKEDLTILSKVAIDKLSLTFDLWENSKIIWLF